MLKMGMVFSRLTVIGVGQRCTSGRFRWLCRCHCGEEVNVRATQLLSGATRSCACLNAELSRRRLQQRSRKARFVVLAALVCLLPVFGQGRLQPIQPKLEKYLLVDSLSIAVTINGPLASVSIDHYVCNSSGQTLEADFLMPLASETSMDDLALRIDGKMQEGQLLDSREAESVYAEIVRNMRDPALLQFVGRNLYRVRIFPLPPGKTRRLQVRYKQLMQRQNGSYKFILPLASIGQSQLTHLRLRCTVNDRAVFAPPYSPTHPLPKAVQKGNSYEIDYSVNGLSLARDFIMLMSEREEIIQSSLLAFRPRSDKDGYFLLNLHPDMLEYTPTAIAKDIIFVVDQSGSMSGEKIAQVKQALNFCLQRLDKSDRFAILPFASQVQLFAPQLRFADAAAKADAAYFIDQMQARGGTNIYQALQATRPFIGREKERARSLLFLTDGLPTEGQTEITQILAAADDLITSSTAIFTFGVGHDVNTVLLDQLSSRGQGRGFYVRPGESIEAAMADLFLSISAPLLTDVTYSIEGGRIHSMLPQPPTILYRGQHVVLLGRYGQANPVSFSFTGMLNGREWRQTLTFDLPKRANDVPFIAPLWAQRQINTWLDSIRLNGENEELIESIKDLARAFSLVTPYTAYLVTEQQREIRIAQTTQPEHKSRYQEDMLKRVEGAYGAENDALLEAQSAPVPLAKAARGKNEFLRSQAQDKVNNSTNLASALINQRYIDGRNFRYLQGVWRESGVDPDDVDVELLFLSEAYWQWYQDNRSCTTVLALGPEVLFRFGQQIVRVRREN
jgi:Ca-activated chloride channel family protein